MAKRLLIADDSSNARGILRFMLQNAGFEIVEAEDGEDALEKIRLGAPDLVVLDGMMPRKSGFDACLELKSDPKTASLPVILLTAVAQTSSDRDWARESLADKFLAKPFRMQELITAIEMLLGLPVTGGTAIRRKA